MRIGFNARLLFDRSTRGWNRYAVNLLSELEGMGIDLILYAQQPVHEAHRARFPGAEVRIGPPMRYLLWQEIWLPRQCAADRIDVLHSPFNFGLPWSSPCPRVLTLHDAIFHSPDAMPGSSSPRPGPRDALARFLHWEARTRAHRIITVSEHAKGDLVRRLGLPGEKISVVYEAADPRFHAPVAEAQRRKIRGDFSLRRPYVLYIGGFEERKNVAFLVEAFARAGLPETELVLCGGDEKSSAALRRSAAALGAGGKLRLPGWVPDALLPALYAEALCFVYPSRHEGFGLQLCEAMAVGCPILASNATSLPEILGDGGETFSLESCDGLANQLKKTASDAGRRSELSARAKRRSNAFDWRITAEKTIETYKQASSKR